MTEAALLASGIWRSGVFECPGPLNRVSRARQFRAVLHKNFILQTRGRKSLLGLEGWAALLVEMLVPAAFFILMCIPRYWIPPGINPMDIRPPVDLDTSSYGGWSKDVPYDGKYFCKPSVLSVLNTPQ